MRTSSRDGTPIAYTRAGSGPLVILVGGGLDDGRENEPLAAALATSGFTAVNYSRRGRGDSGDTFPYAPAREVEDIEALIAEVGGPAHLVGVSTGGALALSAAVLDVRRIAVYEVPYGVGGTPAWEQYVGSLNALLAEGRRGEAVELFMRMAGSSEEGVAGAKASPLWPGLEALAHTLAYDAAVLGDGRPPRVEQPVLALSGAEAGLFSDAADLIAATLPSARRRTLPGLGHVPDPDVLVPVLREFLV